MRLTGLLALLAGLAGCPAPQPATAAGGASAPAGSQPAEPTDADADSDSDADSDADSDSDSDADADSDSDADADSDSENREPTAENREPAAEPAPERRAVCSEPDPPTGAGADCPGVRRRWENIPSRHMRCRTDGDCVAVAAGHCRHVGLNTRAARSRRYRVPVCAGRGEGACGGGEPRVRCEAGCCEAIPAGLGGFF